jgi:hypothetical protein
MADFSDLAAENPVLVTNAAQDQRGENVRHGERKIIPAPKSKPAAAG